MIKVLFFVILGIVIFVLTLILSKISGQKIKKNGLIKLALALSIGLIISYFLN